MKVFTVAQMVAAERAADAAGWSYEAMMEAAGKAVANLILERCKAEDQRVVVFVGPGNNGGDGLVTGRCLSQAGAQVTLYLSKRRDPQTDKQYHRAQAVDLTIIQAEDDPELSKLSAILDQATIIIDALLGTGSNRPLQGLLANILRKAADGTSQSYPETASLHSIATVKPQPTTKSMVVAVDCPSGLQCDSGQIDPLTLPADITVTFAAPKWGHFLLPGSEICGELVVADIHIDPTLPVIAELLIELATPNLIRQNLPRRPKAGHKGTFGRVLLIGGSDRHRGAPVLAGMGAFRAGAGLVNLAVPAVARQTAVGLLPEASYPPLPDEKLLGERSAEWLRAELAGFKGILVGPGLGPAGPFLDTLLQPGVTLPPLIFDADALNWLATQPEWHKRLPARSVLTPHPGEMARLVDLPLPQLLEKNRIELARDCAAKWSQIVLLKGAHTVVAHPDGRVVVLPFANPLLGVGGSGDVLGGVIVALLGQGLSTWQAAFVGAYLHGAAGELAKPKYGEAGLLASEIANFVTEARRLLTPTTI